MESVVPGLKERGKLILVGVSTDPIELSPMLLIRKTLSVMGWASGSSIDSEDTLEFSALTGVRSMNQVFPLEKAAEAYDLMMSGKARFRVVLDMTK